MPSSPQPYYRPRTPATLSRQSACLTFAAREHAYGYWSYIARFGDVGAYTMKGWPDATKWYDLDEALKDAAGTLALLAELARFRGDAAVRAFLEEAVARERAKAGEVADAG